MRNGNLLTTSQVYEFGVFRLEADELFVNTQTVKLAPKVLQCLTLLIERNGKTITKDEFFAEVWPDTFVEDNALSYTISQLRKTLAEFDKETKYIETVARRGFRFVAKVKEIGPRRADEIILQRRSVEETWLEETIDSDSPRGVANQLPSALRRTNRLWLVSAILLIGISVGGFLGYQAWQANASASAIRSIAILPLKSLNADDSALSFGFADALITNLGNAGDVKVLSANAVSRYGDLQKEPLEIGRELGVESVLDGTLQQANGKLRVTLRLIRTSDGTQIWSGLFSEDEREIFRLQDTLAFQTAQALALNFAPKEGKRRPTDNLEAYNLFLKGDYLFRQRAPGLNHFLFLKQAIALDPNFARARASLAAATAMGTEIEEAENELAKALELDPNLAEAHATRGFIRMFHYWDWAQAEQSLNRAVELDPSSAQARHWRGVYLSFHGRLDEAKAEMQRALELDPLNLNFMSDLGQLYYFAREYGQAEEYCKKALAIDPDYGLAHGYLMQIYNMQERNEEAFEQYLTNEIGGDYSKENLKRVEVRKEAFRRGGWAEVDRVVREYYSKLLADEKIPKEKLSAHYHGIVTHSLRFGDKDKTIEYLNRSLETKTKFETMNFSFPYMKVDPRWDALRGNPRFDELLRKINL